jgi:hypothetical protein
MNTAIVLVLAVVCFFIGIIAAYLMQSLREESKPADEDLRMHNMGEDAVKTIEDLGRLGQVSVPTAEQVVERQVEKAPPTGMVEVARFWRDRTSQKPAVEMDGALFHKAEQMSQAQLDKLGVAIHDLAAWARKPILGDELHIETSAFLTGEPTDRPGFKPAKMGPLDIIKNTLDAEVRSALKSEPKSLAAQVDEILQNRLAGTSLSERGIRIMDTPSADLIVMVGLQKYDGIDAIPDADIQAVIREAVAEWGRRASLEGGASD